MSNNLEPKEGDKIEKPFQPDINKGETSFVAPPKPVQPEKPQSTTSQQSSKNKE
jgi:hypothetical protein